MSKQTSKQANKQAEAQHVCTLASASRGLFSTRLVDCLSLSLSFSSPPSFRTAPPRSRWLGIRFTCQPAPCYAASYLSTWTRASSQSHLFPAQSLTTLTPILQRYLCPVAALPWPLSGCHHGSFNGRWRVCRASRSATTNRSTRSNIVLGQYRQPQAPG